MGAELLAFLVRLSAVLRLENVENGGRGQNVEDIRLDHRRWRESARAPGPPGSAGPRGRAPGATAEHPSGGGAQAHVYKPSGFIVH